MLKIGYLNLYVSGRIPVTPASSLPTPMKEAIHPDYNQITISCGSCGTSFQVGSTMKNDLRVEICARCHPLYTGKAKLIDTTGRVDRFQARQQKAQAFRDVSNVKLEETVEA